MGPGPDGEGRSRAGIRWNGPRGIGAARGVRPAPGPMPTRTYMRRWRPGRSSPGILSAPTNAHCRLRRQPEAVDAGHRRRGTRPAVPPAARHAAPLRAAAHRPRRPADAVGRLARADPRCGSVRRRVTPVLLVSGAHSDQRHRRARTASGGGHHGRRHRAVNRDEPAGRGPDAAGGLSRCRPGCTRWLLGGRRSRVRGLPRTAQGLPEPMPGQAAGGCVRRGGSRRSRWGRRPVPAPGSARSSAGRCRSPPRGRRAAPPRTAPGGAPGRPRR
ncbi:hypothetical protein SAMN05660350_03438 [Geodermatophilus obscurus]|uniref:Uncharacterized protein n=1 Tax=Geodermatophilus obscurus TaxID=1861 RepID=A0A1M7UKJ5_9ACTN|nr:hypothetical protein SAMN05660350_03438 [Geodermatophilus obscurus]